ncbi:MAG: c-type cytochrome [Gemmatimonadales bacterium]
MSLNRAGPIALAVVLGLGQAGCNTKGADDAAPAPVDTGTQTGVVDTVDTTGAPAANDTVAPPAAGDTMAAPRAGDTMTVPEQADTVAPGRPDTSAATPPIAPPAAEAAPDSPPTGAEPSQQGQQGQGLEFTPVEYEGWRQYSVNCARCHGQDVLPNPVAANLLVSVAPGGTTASPDQFFQVVSEGRPERGMPAFKDILTPEQINAIYAYVKGRAEKRLAPGRPERPET